jgi:amino acid permease
MLSNGEGGISVPSSNRISNLMAICGLLNGMIGGTILLLPIIGLNTGYLMSVIISIFVGVCSYYTGNLTVVHLGTAKDMKECILQHFDGKYGYMIVYSFVVWIGQIPLLILYYNLICIQLEGLFGESGWISIVVGCALLLGSIQVLSVDLG